MSMPQAQTAVPSQFRDLTVLIVDDSFNMRALMRKMVRSLGFGEIIEADSGTRALEALSQQLVDLVLCDWNMPGLKGIDVLKFVRSREETRNLPFIMVTAEMSAAIVAEAAESEVDDYMVKPFSLAELQARIQKIIKVQEEITDLEVHLKRGTAFVATDQFKKASAEFKKAQLLNPKSPRTLLEIGRLYMKQGLDGRALEYFERAVHFSPKFLKGHQELAQLHLALGNTEKYIHHLEQSVQISPRNLERKIMLGDAHMQNGNTEQAKAVFEQVLEEATTQYSEIAEKIGEALLKLESYEVAERAFGRALEANPKNLILFNKLGIAFRKQGKFDKAVDNYLKAIKIAPNDETLYFNLARAYQDAGALDKAMAALKKALSINSGFSEAKALLAKIAAKAKA